MILNIVKNTFEKNIGHYTLYNLNEFLNLPLALIKEKKADSALFNLNLYPYGTKTRASATNLNFIKTNFMILDFDSGISIDEVCLYLKDFTYLGYTSGSNSLSLPKFRIILQLKESVLIDDIAILKNKLTNKFKGVDPTTFAKNRFFYFPTSIDKEGNKTKFFKNEAKDYDFYLLHKIDLKCAKMEFQKEVDTYTYKEKDFTIAIDKINVKYFLSHFYPKVSGNGDSASSLYKAICTCIACKDTKTLDIVLSKARSERWSQQELNRMILKAKNFCNK